MKNYRNAVNKKLKSSLADNDFYSCHVCGKRNNISEGSSRYYGSWEKLYKLIQSSYSSGNIFEVEIKEEYDYGEDYEHCLFAETEYYGMYYKYPVITIKTPKTNKIKAIINGRDI